MLSGLPKPLLEICETLEGLGISSWVQGEALLDALRPRRAFAGDAAATTLCVLCGAEAADLLARLPRAVVTASHARRLTLASPAGPVDLLPIGRTEPDQTLLDFGLSPLAFAYRPAGQDWSDPGGARARFEAGLLDVATPAADPFDRAPRRYWIAARLLAEYALRASPELLGMARAALPDALARLPEGAPARRELARVLACDDPTPALAFLREAGICPELFPGMHRTGERILPGLPRIPALRWAAWLRGSAVQSAMVRLRMPIDLARRIERLHRAHPLDRSLEALGDAGLRKLLARLTEQEIAGLLTWRRLELREGPETEDVRVRSRRLAEVESRLDDLRTRRERTGRVRALAIDGRAVMEALGSGPGPHVGRALAHLAAWIEAHPEANERDALLRELRDWAEREAEAIR